jgi:hypothetical protein
MVALRLDFEEAADFLIDMVPFLDIGSGMAYGCTLQSALSKLKERFRSILWLLRRKNSGA